MVREPIGVGHAVTFADVDAASRQVHQLARASHAGIPPQQSALGSRRRMSNPGAANRV